MKSRLFISISLIVSLWCTTYGQYFVLLKDKQTLDSFISYDETYPDSERVLPYIQESYNIGDSLVISGEFPEKALKRLRRCPMVSELTADITFQAFELMEQDDAPRHLVSLSNQYGHSDHRNSYYYDNDVNGKGVNVYVIDGGIDRQGRQFSGRILAGVDFTNNTQGTTDVHGHGTHVAGIIGSKTFGVAKDADLIILKVLDSQGQGSLGLIVSALEFAVNHHRQSGIPGVANLSLGAPYSTLINRVVDSVSRAGLVVVVAAGNAAQNACNVLPASAKSAITVGAIDDRTNRIAEFSNWGPCVDIFASGVDVASVSAKKLKLQKLLKLLRQGLHVYSGTSMAAPVVAGLIANFLSMGISPDSVKNHMLELAIDGSIPRDDIIARPNTPNLVAYNGLDPEDLDGESESESDIDT